MSFSRRMGITPEPVDLPIDAMPERLKNQIWNVLRKQIFFDKLMTSGYLKSDFFARLSDEIWSNHWGRDIDQLSIYPSDTLQQIKDIYNSLNYFEIYNFLEFLAEVLSQSNFDLLSDPIIHRLNQVFSANSAAVRFVGVQIMPITNELEREEVEAAVSQTRFSAASEHIRTAIKSYSIQTPHYRNSVKESISAIESVIAEATGKQSPDSARPLKELKEQYGMHPAFADSFNKLFAWTSDENGIRHALMDDSRDISQSEARLMLICASAFVNHVKALDAD